jgi:putative Holliday junction resolvase
MGPLSAQVEGVLSFRTVLSGLCVCRRSYLCILVGRILAIDFGLKRTGIAVTDPLRIIAHGLETIDTSKLRDFIRQYVAVEPVDEFVVGYPFLYGTWGDRTFKQKLDELIMYLEKEYPTKPLTRQDERNSSIIAKDIILRSGKNKKQRQDKRLLDKTSAIVILQEYLGHI